MARVVVLVAVVGVCGSAFARPPGASGLPQAQDVHGLLAVDRSRVEGHGATGVRLDLGYLHSPLHFFVDGRDLEVVKHDFAMRLVAHVTLWRRLEVGLSLAGGWQRYLKSTDVPFGDQGQFALGDVRILAKVLAVRTSRIGFAAQVAFGTNAGGDNLSYRSDGIWQVEPRLVFDAKLGRLTLIANLGARLHETLDIKDALGRTLFSIGQELTWGAAAHITAHKQVGVALELAGTESLNPTGDAQRTLAILASVFAQVGGGVGLYVGAGRSLAPDAARTDVIRILAGLTWQLEPRVVEPPRPEPVMPVQLVASPEPVVQDSDGDLVLDDKDRCPAEPEDRDQFQDEDGCPDPDNDGDGVADSNDLCPTQAETQNKHQDDDGCPDEAPVSLAPLVLPAPLTFGKNEAQLKGPQPALDRLADGILARPKGGIVRLEGHAEKSEAPPKKLQALSQARADAVRDYLLAKGVDAKRVQAVGYAATRPAGKLPAANRRVEFILVDQ